MTTQKPLRAGLYAFLAASLLAASLIATPEPAAAAGCSPGGPGEWTGLGDGVSWFVTGNWVGNPADFDNTTDVCIEPGSATTVVIPTSTIDLNGLRTDSSTTLQLSGNVALSGDLDIDGPVVSTTGDSTVTDTTAPSVPSSVSSSGGVVRFTNAVSTPVVSTSGYGGFVAFNGNGSSVGALSVGASSVLGGFGGDGDTTAATLDWTGGNFSGAGTLTVGAQTTVSGTTDKSMSYFGTGYDLSTNGPTTWSQGTVLVNSGSV